MRVPIRVAPLPTPLAMTSPTPNDDGRTPLRPLVDTLRRFARGAADVAQALLERALGFGVVVTPQLVPVRPDLLARSEGRRSGGSWDGLHRGPSAGRSRKSEDAA